MPSTSISIENWTCTPNGINTYIVQELYISWSEYQDIKKNDTKEIQSMDMSKLIYCVMSQNKCNFLHKLKKYIIFF
jgi:hypothetical protein